MIFKSEQVTKSTLQIKEAYDLKFKETIMKDEDCAYAWMAQSLFPQFIKFKRVLDLGCGGGYLLVLMQKTAQQVCGVDISGEALKLAKLNGAQYLVQASADQLPYSNRAFDTLFCLGTLQLFPNLSKAISEMIRLVHQDGRIILMVPNSYWYKDFFSVIMTGNTVKRDVSYEFIGSLKQWTNLLQSNGLKIRKIWKYNGISNNHFKQTLKTMLVPLRVSYQFIFVCQASSHATN